MGWAYSTLPSLSSYDKDGVPDWWFGYSLFLWEGLLGPGVAATFWNPSAAFGLLVILSEYFGEALLGGWIDWYGWHGLIQGRPANNAWEAP